MNRLFFPNHYPLSKIVFFLFLFFLPQQFGPHFWPDFSYVYGIRVDYLSPFIYISLLLLLILIITSFKTVFKNSQTILFLANTKTLIFLTALLIPLLYTHSIQAFYFSIFKFLFLFYLGIYSATQLTKKDLFIVSIIFSTVALFESLLSVFQFLHQGSLNGMFYFLGERLYTSSTPGIAVMNLANGLTVRPYGTFPHPNVLAYFLFISTLFTMYTLSSVKRIMYKYSLFLFLAVIQIGLFITFSRVLIILNVVLFLLLLGIKQLKGLKISVVIGTSILVGFTLYVLTFSLRFLNFSSILSDTVARLEVLPIVFLAVVSHPLGLGLSNFFYYQGSRQTTFSSTYLQPVHNIFLLLLVETGIICTILFVYFLGLTLVKLTRRINKNGYMTIHSVVFVILIVSIISGMFDHYLITIWQSQLLFAIILGLSWNKNI